MGQPELIDDRPNVRMCRVRAHPELIEVRLPRHNCPCILKELHYGSIIWAREALQDARGAGRREVGGADVVFHGDELPVNGRQWSP